MKLAITYEDGEVFQHFGKTEEFKIFDIENGKILSSKVKDTEGRGHGDIVYFLKENNIDVLICGGIGGGAKNIIDSNGIKLYSGVSGSVDLVAEAFASGKLEQITDANCTEHEGSGHNCSCNCHH